MFCWVLWAILVNSSNWRRRSLEPPICSQSVRRLTPGLMTGIWSRGWSLSPLPVGSDSISRNIVSELSWILGHPACILGLLVGVGKAPHIGIGTQHPLSTSLFFNPLLRFKSSSPFSSYLLHFSCVLIHTFCPESCQLHDVLLQRFCLLSVNFRPRAHSKRHICILPASVEQKGGWV